MLNRWAESELALAAFNCCSLGTHRRRRSLGSRIPYWRAQLDQPVALAPMQVQPPLPEPPPDEERPVRLPPPEE